MDKIDKLLLNKHMVGRNGTLLTFVKLAEGNFWANQRNQLIVGLQAIRNHGNDSIALLKDHRGDIVGRMIIDGTVHELKFQYEYDNWFMPALTWEFDETGVGTIKLSINGMPSYELTAQAHIEPRLMNLMMGYPDAFALSHTGHSDGVATISELSSVFKYAMKDNEKVTDAEPLSRYFDETSYTIEIEITDENRQMYSELFDVVDPPEEEE